MIRYFWDVAVALDQTALELDEGRRFQICRPSPLADLAGHRGSHLIPEPSVRVLRNKSVLTNFCVP
jgi:hypothetical protein